MSSHTTARASELDSYLAELAAALTGPRRQRNAVVQEVADGLGEAAHRYRTQGLTAGQARRAAINEFGPPEQLAAGFAGELAVASARHSIAALLLTGPAVGIWWLLLLAPAAWWQQPLRLWAAIPALPLVGAAVLTGIAVLATTGQLTRWLPETTPARALRLAAGLAVVCVGIDGTMLILVGIRTLNGQPNWHPLLVAAAMVASLIRLACTLCAVHGLLSHRGAPSWRMFTFR